MTYAEYEQAMADAHGDADEMLSACMKRIDALEKALRDLIQAVNMLPE
jgi:hypothetical protein